MFYNILVKRCFAYISWHFAIFVTLNSNAASTKSVCMVKNERVYTRSNRSVAATRLVCSF